MPARTGCCQGNTPPLPLYTTRAYWPNGNTRWTQNCCAGITSGGDAVKCQRVDTVRGHVYVGASRTSPTSIAGVCCLDITNGNILWYTSLGAVPIQIQIDLSGNVVCMFGGIGATTTSFKVLDPTAGTVLNTYSFTNNTLAASGSPTFFPSGIFGTRDFVIDSNGDYNVVGIIPTYFGATSTFAGGSYQQNGNPGYTMSQGNGPYIYKFASPFTSAPTVSASIQSVGTAFGGITLAGQPYYCSSDVSIKRYGNRDYIGTSGAILRGIAQAGPPMATTDIDGMFPDSYATQIFPMNIGGPTYYDGTGVTCTTASPSGTTQAGAFALVAGKVYVCFTGGINTPPPYSPAISDTTSSGNRAVILPNTPNAVIKISYDSRNAAQPLVFPPIGGYIIPNISSTNSLLPGATLNASVGCTKVPDQYYLAAPGFGTLQFSLGFAGDTFFSDNTGMIWYMLSSFATIHVGKPESGIQDYYGGYDASSFFVDSAGAMYYSRKFGSAALAKLDNSNNFKWAVGLNTTHITGDNASIYTLGAETPSTTTKAATFSRNAGTGTVNWCHRHLNTGNSSNSTSLGEMIEYDSVDGMVIASGATVESAVNDISFTSDPHPTFP